MVVVAQAWGRVVVDPVSELELVDDLVDLVCADQVVEGCGPGVVVQCFGVPLREPAPAARPPRRAQGRALTLPALLLQWTTLRSTRVSAGFEAST